MQAIRLERRKELNVMYSITELKNTIMSIKNPTPEDRKVLSIIDSFWGCPKAYVKAEVAGRISKYAGCKAWNIAMDVIYKK